LPSNLSATKDLREQEKRKEIHKEIGSRTTVRDEEHDEHGGREKIK
jgi:hypothetical protein